MVRILIKNKVNVKKTVYFTLQSILPGILLARRLEVGWKIRKKNLVIMNYPKLMMNNGEE